MDMASILPAISNKKITGILNEGCTCYLNSCVQCFSCCLPLTYYFFKNDYKMSINLNNPQGTNGNIARAYFDLLCALWYENNQKISASKFREVIGLKNRIFL